MVRRYLELRHARLVLMWGDLKFAPKSVDILLLVVHSRILHHVVPDGRVSTISANHEVEVNLDFRDSFLGLVYVLTHFKPRLFVSEIGPRKFVVEKEGHVRHFFEDVKETLVETTSING